MRVVSDHEAFLFAVEHVHMLTSNHEIKLYFENFENFEVYFEILQKIDFIEK